MQLDLTLLSHQFRDILAINRAAETITCDSLCPAETLADVLLPLAPAAGDSVHKRLRPPA